MVQLTSAAGLALITINMTATLLIHPSREFLLNCKSNEERYQWMQHIQSAIPESSPVPARANPTATSEKPKEEPERQDRLEEEKTRNCSPPNRQETVDEAAMLAISGHHG